MAPPVVLLEQPPPAPQTAPPHGATVKYVYDHLREDILQRRLGPGSRLIENDLTQRFDVSRGPIREALRRLAAEGLIEHVPNRGGMVRRLSRTEMREFFEIRIELERSPCGSRRKTTIPSRAWPSAIWSIPYLTTRPATFPNIYQRTRHSTKPS